MIIIPDTNILRTSYGLRSTEWKILLSGCSNADHMLYIPEVVVAEIVSLYSREAKQCQSELSKLNKKYAGLELKGRNLLDTSLHMVDTVSYESFLRRTLSGAIFLPLPETSSELVLRRILDKKRPFNEGESGYRDYLIWLTILEIAKSSCNQIAFITSNTKDFCDDPTNKLLAADLILDLEDNGLPSDQVKLYTSLALFNQTQITPALEELHALQNRLNSDAENRLDKMKIARESLEWLLSYEDIVAAYFNDDPVADSPELHDLQSLTRVEIKDIRKLERHEILLRFAAHVDATFRAYMDDERYQQMKAKPFVDSIDSGVITISYVKEFDVEFEITYDTDERQITSGDIVDVNL